MNLETIVNNMISANEPESNIAMVIKTFKQVRDSKKKKSPLTASLFSQKSLK